MVEGPKYSPGSNREPFKHVIKFDVGREKKQEIGGSFISRKYEIENVANSLGEDLDDVGIATEVKNLFEYLNKKYNIPVSVQVVLSEGEEGTVINLLSKKIDGKQLKLRPDGAHFKLSEIDKKRLTKEMNDLYAGLTKYALENANSEHFLWDIAGADQYMWGKQKDKDGIYDSEPHLYLVDIGLNMSTDGLSTFVGDLLSGIRNYELFLDTKFVEARNTLQKMVDAGMIEPERIELINGLH